MQEYAFYESPIGLIKISGNKAGISAIGFAKNAPDEYPEVPEALDECVEQLEDYFAKKRFLFDLPMQLDGTDFQKAVWEELLHIPYGRTDTYLAVAQRLGDRKAVRAVGAAAGKNPLMIVVPCHRLIGTSGHLTGYAGGLAAKQRLLMLENALAHGIQKSLF